MQIEMVTPSMLSGYPVSAILPDIAAAKSSLSTLHANYPNEFFAIEDYSKSGSMVVTWIPQQFVYGYLLKSFIAAVNTPDLLEWPRAN